MSYKHDLWPEYMCFFYKHGVFQSAARICLSFSQIEPQNMLKYAYLKTFKTANFMI